MEAYTHGSALLLADVVVDTRAPGFDQPFTYRVPEALAQKATPGALTLVPFGAQRLLGYVVHLRHVPEDKLPLPKHALKFLIDVLHAPPLDSDLFELARWVSEEYLAGLGASLHASVPPAARSRLRTILELVKEPEGKMTEAQEKIIESIKRMKGAATAQALKRGMDSEAFGRASRQLREKGILRQTIELVAPPRAPRSVALVRLAASEERVDEFFKNEGKRRPSQAALLMKLLDHPEGALPQSELLEAVGGGADALKRLEEEGLIAREAEETLIEESAAPPRLTKGQAQAVKTLSEALERKRYEPFLLYGVTASGKTEVYLRAAAECLRLGRGVLYLLPEIALTAQVIGQVKARFGKAVAVLHSHLADTERFDQWQRIRSGETPIVIGARSAVFAPVPNLGLVILDEEHEPSYKQEIQPRYHARRIALERARRSEAVIALGSATPALESFYAAQSEELGLIQLPQRVAKRPLPSVEIVDMREEFKAGRIATLTPPLCEAIQGALEQNQQAILFLNRRAYASFLLCRLCGHVPQCPDCSVSLAYHQTSMELRCHHCDHLERVPSQCAQCSGSQLKPFGVGTQRVEEEAQKLFPQARTVRLDRDVLVKKEAYLDVIRQFRTGEADILVGTQMVAKGLDFPRVAVVGVVNADTGMHLPDFRAGERTFQLLTQVAGRAGRGETPGRVIVQTFAPDHPAVLFGQKHDFDGFYEQEIVYRRQLNYPPFSRLANFVVSHQEEGRAAEVAASLTENLQIVARRADPLTEVLGPTPAPMARVKTLYRWHALLKAPIDAPLPAIARETLQRIDLRGCSVSVDIDPQSLM